MLAHRFLGRAVLVLTVHFTTSGCVETSRQQIEAPITFTGLGIVSGLNGRGDGPNYKPLNLMLSASKKYSSIRSVDAAVVTLTAVVPQDAATVSVLVSTTGHADDLTDGYLNETPMQLPGSKDVWIAVGPVKAVAGSPWRGTVECPIAYVPRSAG